jgi:methyltransferase (TIGR00027 family)
MRAGRPSMTAVKVARVLVWLGHQPRYASLLPRGAVEATERLLQAVGLLPPWMMRLFDSRGSSRALEWVDRALAPGESLPRGLRKRFLEDEVRRALAEGVRQVLVIGAGLDTLCLRLAPEHPQVRFVEVDHPATQAVKRRGLEALGPLPPNLHLLAVDLARTPLEQALAGLGAWQAQERTVAVAEGVLMYLEERSISTFLQALRRCTGPSSRLLFTYLAQDEQGQLRFGWVTGLLAASLHLVGEPFRWSARPSELGPFLERHGYALDISPERVNLRRRYLEPAGLHSEPLGEGELMAVADMQG